MKCAFTLEELKQFLTYMPETGQFIRKRDAKVLGRRRSNGYYAIAFRGDRYYAHRLAWFFMMGVWPERVDHADRDKSNNSWKNLRFATHAQNRVNSPGIKKRSTKSGVKGVYYDAPRRLPYRAYISFKGKRTYLGNYATLEEAKQVYTTAALKLYGEFAYVA